MLSLFIVSYKFIFLVVIIDYTYYNKGDKAIVKLEFTTRPEYIKVGMKIIFREGKVRAFGNVMETFSQQLLN